MSKRPAFEPSGFAKTIDKTENYATDSTLVYEWAGTHWKALDDTIVMRMALQWIETGKHGTVNAANAQAAFKTALLWLPMIADPSEQTIIPLHNGYLRYDGSLVLMPHDKKLGLRHVLACDYEPSAPTPTEFNAFLERILPDVEVRCRVQEYIGYTLLSDTRFQRAQMWIGAGANGKGALANMVQALHERCAAVQLDALDGFFMANMLDASLIYCDEAPQRGINEQKLKSLIAGELVQINRKYRDAISARVNGKWIILGNHIPAITDQSTGFWRRFDIVPFSVEIPESERDPMLAKRIIDHELTGVLNWALEGLQRLLGRGRFDASIPTAMRSSIHSARLETNSIQGWVHAQGIELTTAIDTPKADVYANYAGWCKSNGMVPIASPKFWRQLPDSLGFVEERRVVLPNGSRPWAVNVQLRPSW